MTDPITVDLSDVIATIVRDELPPLARIVDMLPALVYALDGLDVRALDITPHAVPSSHHITVQVKTRSQVDQAADVLDLGPDNDESPQLYARCGTFGPWRVRVYSGRAA